MNPAGPTIVKRFFEWMRETHRRRAAISFDTSAWPQLALRALGAGKQPDASIRAEDFPVNDFPRHSAGGVGPVLSKTGVEVSNKLI